MDTAGLDGPKLKRIVIERWRSAPTHWPVKVLSISRMLELEQQLGRKLNAVGGYFTCVKNICLRTPAEMEDILGFQKGTFGSGVSVWKLNDLPKPEEFELRGYTQTPRGESFDGFVIRRSDLQRPHYLKRDGTIEKFPPGLGVEQWELARDVLLSATELERVPSGARFVKCI
jgi:hypothetical protein